MLLPGWKRRVQSTDIIYEDMSSREGETFTRHVSVTADGVTLQIDRLKLLSVLEVAMLARMLIDCWTDVLDLRAQERGFDDEEETSARRQAFADGFTTALRFCETRTRRLAGYVATSEQPLAARWFLRFAEAIGREVKDSMHVE